MKTETYIKALHLLEIAHGFLQDGAYDLDKIQTLDKKETVKKIEKATTEVKEALEYLYNSGI